MLISKVLLLLCLGFCFSSAAKHWVDKRSAHKARSVTSSKAGSLWELAQMKTFYDVELKPILKERVSGTAANKEVQEHIKARMNALGWDIKEDEFEDETPYGKKMFNNIITTLDPNAPRQLVLACHFDSKFFKNFKFIAATDSAVPCAMLLDLARILNRTLHAWMKKDKPEVTLQFIFLDGEEAFKDWTDTDSLYGARHLAEKLHGTPHPLSGEKELTMLRGIDAFVLLDLIGAKNPNFQNFFPQTSKLFERLISIEKKLDPFLHPHTRYFQLQPSYGSNVQDDHVPFLTRGVPVLHLICVPFPRVWHNKGDNEEAIDLPTVANLNAILRVFVVEYLRITQLLPNKDEL